MIRAGIPEKQARRISGHKTRSMFDRYDTTDERDIQLAGQKLAHYLEEKARTAERTTDSEQSDVNRRPGSLQ